MNFLHLLYIPLTILDFLVSVFLIYIVLIQESKTDGLQGQIGSVSPTTFKGKAGKDEKMTEITKKTSIAFFVLTLLIAIVHTH